MALNYQPFVFGVIVGFTVAFLMLAPSFMYKPLRIDQITPRKTVYQINDENFTLEGREFPNSDVGNHGTQGEIHSMLNESVAEYLYEKVRVLCMILTSPSNYETKAKHVKATWGKRCNVLLFMSSKEDNDLPAVALPVVEDYDHLWQKTKESMKYVYKNYYDQADWFLKADDDTYVVMENLRYLLHSANSSDPVYYGCRFKPYVKQGYMSGGAGYVLSKEALRRLVETSLPNKTLCKEEDVGNEDLEIGKCLESVDVKPGDERDEESRARFFPLNVEAVLIPGYFQGENWYHQYLYYKREEGMNCCSDTAISFHYMKPNDMYVMEYLIYHVRPFGIGFNPVISANETTEYENWEDLNDVNE